jgi:hypothetical protein
MGNLPKNKILYYAGAVLICVALFFFFFHIGKNLHFKNALADTATPTVTPTGTPTGSPIPTGTPTATPEPPGAAPPAPSGGESVCTAISSVACPQLAKQCPDGSYVSPTGPNCEFAPCPTPFIFPGLGEGGGCPEETPPAVTPSESSSPSIPITQVVGTSKTVNNGLAIMVATLIALAAIVIFTKTLLQVISGLLPVYSIASRSLLYFPFDFLLDFFKGFWQSIVAFFASLFGFVYAKVDKRGIVFDAANGKPIEAAYLIMYSPSGNLISAFSDKYGKYSFEPRPDSYSLKANKINYIFPSQLVQVPSNYTYSHIYINGEKIEIKAEGEKVYDMAIPLDPKVNPSIFNKLFVKIGHIWNFTIGKFSVLLEILSLVSTGILAFFDPWWVYNVIFAVLVTLYLLQIILKLEKK